jgi:hypothetical protein
MQDALAPADLQKLNRLKQIGLLEVTRKDKGGVFNGVVFLAIYRLSPSIIQICISTMRQSNEYRAI